MDEYEGPGGLDQALMDYSRGRQEQLNDSKEYFAIQKLIDKGDATLDDVKNYERLFLKMNPEIKHGRRTIEMMMDPIELAKKRRFRLLAKQEKNKEQPNLKKWGC